MVRSTENGVEVWFAISGTGSKVSWPLGLFTKKYFGGEISPQLFELGTITPLTPKDREELVQGKGKLPLLQRGATASVAGGR